MRPRRAVPFLIPTIALYPRQLLFYDPRPPGTHLKSTLLQVFILENLKTFGINTGSVDILVKVGVPQAVEVVGKAEEQGLANLDR